MYQQPSLIFKEGNCKWRMRSNPTIKEEKCWKAQRGSDFAQFRIICDPQNATSVV